MTIQGESRIAIIKRTFVIIEMVTMNSMNWNHIPIDFARCATGLRVEQTSFCASMRISSQLLIKANSGPSGNAAPNMVINPKRMTGIG